MMRGAGSATVCGRCHSCGTELRVDDWCVECRAFRRYVEHGYGAVGEVGSECEDAASWRQREIQRAGSGRTGRLKKAS